MRNGVAKTLLICMGAGAESSNLKCLADKWSNLQFLSMENNALPKLDTLKHVVFGNILVEALFHMVKARE